MKADPRVFVVDDQPAIRSTLQRVFSSAGLAVHAYATGPEFLEAWRDHAPACLVLDVDMPGMNGLEVQRELAQRGLRIPTIFLTGSADISMAVAAMRAGAADFFEKPVDNTALVRRVREVLAHESQHRSQELELKEIETHAARLTPREREVMRYIVAGKSSKAIGQILGISARTIDVHRARIMEKMRAESLADLVRRALHLERGG